MTLTQEAAQAFSCQEKYVEPFLECDPYNPSQTIEGALCHVMDHRYGALFIQKINGAYHPQVIPGVGKIHYPFQERPDGKRIYTFADCYKVHFREKLDGTSIAGFCYTNGTEWFASFKTRLTPFLRATSKWNNWLKLMAPMIEQYSSLVPLLKQYPQQTFAFELYGKINPHMITYQEPLNLVMLFRVDRMFRVLPALDSSQCDLPSAKIVETCQPEHLVKTYERLREELESKNKASVASEQGFLHEGCVLNLCHTDGTISLFKMKPETVEEIHFAAGGGLSKNLVKQACWKVFEHDQELTSQTVANELAQDFDLRIIQSFEQEIHTVIQEVLQEITFKKEVLTLYHQFGITNKQELMRKFSEVFPKGQMGKVYQVLHQGGYV